MYNHRTLLTTNVFDHRKRFARAHAYANAIWSRWIKEYIPLLNQRGKLYSDYDRHLKVGELVSIIDPTARRGFGTQLRF